MEAVEENDPSFSNMETLEENEDPPAENENADSSSHQTDSQIVREELAKIVDIVEQTVGKTGAKIHKSDQRGPQKHVHIMIQETKQEIKDLAIENKVLQKRLLAIQKRRSTIGTKLFLEGAETQYQIALKQWMDAKEELEKVMDEYNNKIDRMQEIVREKQREAHNLHKEFSTYKWQIAREARHVMSGKRLSSALLDELKAKDLEADMDLERLRIEGRQLASQLKKTQAAILKKDQLSSGLFAVDFEQLKIDHESLNEKLLKKNKELVELGKKTTHIVHVLSHSRERLEFDRNKFKADKDTLESLELELSAARLQFQQLRMLCEKLRSKRERIQVIKPSVKEVQLFILHVSVTDLARRISQTTVNVRTIPLLDDMEAYRGDAKIAEERLKDLKNQYNALIDQIHRQQASIRDEGIVGCRFTEPSNDTANRSLRWGASNMHVKKPILGI